MAFDSTQTLTDMAAAAQEVVAGEWPKVKDCTEEALREQEEALKEIAEACVKGELTEDEMRSQLEDEREAFQMVLLACEVKAKATAQRAANAAFKVLEQAIRACL
jgi:hypothetical protein